MESLRVPGKLDSLKTIRDFVASAAANAGLDKRRTYQLSLAVDEIATNIIAHGYDEAGLQGEILVHTRITDDELQVTIEDAGTPFNPLLQEEPQDLDSPIEVRTGGGLGVFLARKNVDEFRYEFVNGTNCNTLVMKHTPVEGDVADQNY